MTDETGLLAALEPCPLCGNHAFIAHGNAPSVNGYPVWCLTDRCLRLSPHATQAEAIAAWNRRARPTQSSAVDALRALDELDGSDFEAVRGHARTLRAALTAQAHPPVGDGEEGSERETALMAELSGLDQVNITLVGLVRRAMKLIPEGKSLWWDEARAALDLVDRAAALNHPTPAEAQAHPAGEVVAVVPRQPTDAMFEAAAKAWDGPLSTYWALSMWQAMIDSAPPAHPAPASEAGAKVRKFVDNYFAPWGSWKTAWWEGEVSDDAAYCAENALKHVANMVSATTDAAQGQG